MIFGNNTKNNKTYLKNWYNDPALKKAILSDAFFRWENLLLMAVTVIALGVLLALVSYSLEVAFLIAIFWLMAAFIVELIFLYYHLKDEAHRAIVIMRAIENIIEFNIGTIRDPNLQARVYKAFEYWRLINEIISAMKQGPLQAHLLNTSHEVTYWLYTVYTLTKHIDQTRLNLALSSDFQSLPTIVQTIKEKLREEKDPAIRHHLEATFFQRQQQWQTLEKMRNKLKESTYHLDNTLSTLATIYSQLLLLQSNRGTNNQLNQLQTKISEQSHHLEDLLEAMKDVHNLSQANVS